MLMIFLQQVQFQVWNIGGIYYADKVKIWLFSEAYKITVDCKIWLFWESNPYIWWYQHSMITTQGRKHPGAALSMSQFRNEYMIKKINKWVEELHIHSPYRVITSPPSHFKIIPPITRIPPFLKIPHPSNLPANRSSQIFLINRNATVKLS